MKSTILLFAILSTTLYASTPRVEDPTVDYKELRINSLPFITSKTSILKALGKPRKVFEPKYECGFLSESEQGKKYYALQYPNMQFVGNATEGYQLEEVALRANATYSITFRGKPLSSRTTQQEFEHLFGVKVKNGQKTLRYTNADDALVFTFTGGFLTKIEYWSPC